MTFDGKILARARAQIDERRHINESERARREKYVYERIPKLREIDSELARLMADVAVKSLSGGIGLSEAMSSARTKAEALAEKRAELMRQSGLPEDYTDGIYDCPLCRDTGYILGKPCSCLLAAYKSEAVRELSSMLDLGGQCFDRFDLSLYDDKRGKNGDSPRSIMSATYDFCRKYAFEFKSSSPNLLFRGGTGLGKTFLSACIAKVVSEKGFSVVYDSTVSVLEAFEIQKFCRGDGSDDSASRVRRYLNCDLLILDDLGTEMTTGFTQSALYTLINTRLMSGGKTVISTNLTGDELHARYTDAIVSRIEGEYVLLCFAGRDIRAIKRERGLI
ncbi:MAG: ATP-binding protein [Clostridiales bacterium]|jgi:DNA replication protein DnaC|nr:ATP-binding protein [Clostridiales bacterium]